MHIPNIEETNQETSELFQRVCSRQVALEALGTAVGSCIGDGGKRGLASHGLVVA